MCESLYELDWVTRLEHGEEKVLFSALVLVSVNGKHDGLQQRVNFSHGNKTAEMRNVPRLGLEQKEQVAVSLGFVVIGEKPLLKFHSFVKMIRYFVLLSEKSALIRCTQLHRRRGAYFFQGHSVLNE